MQEINQINGTKAHKLKTLKLFQLINNNIQQKYKPFNHNNLTNNENKKKKLYKSNSTKIFMNRINESILKKMQFPSLAKEEEKKTVLYEIEKGIPKNQLCLFSKNKYHFGTSRNMTKFSKIEQNPNPNISTKIPEKKHLRPKSSFRSIAIPNYKKISAEKIQKIKLKRNLHLNTNKIDIYKRYNNETGFDLHRMKKSNKSCIYVKPDIERTYFNNSTKEEVSKISQLIHSRNNNTQIYNLISNNTNTKSIDPLLSTIEYTNTKNSKNRITFNSTMCSREKKPIKKLYDIKKSTINKTTNITNTAFPRSMGKYQFVMNDYLVQLNKNKVIPFEIQNINKYNCNILLRENEKLFTFFGSIIPSYRFSEKYRDPLNNSFDKEQQKEREIKEKTIIKNEILPGLGLLKELEAESEKRKENKNKILKGKPLMLKVKKYLIRNAHYIKRLKVSYEELLYKYKKVSNPLNYFKTEELIMDIRNKNYESCCKILDNYKYIVLDYDYFHFTPLHWAAKVNFYQIIPKLVKYGAPINEQNNIGETPLHISASKNYFESTIFLLKYLASPFIKDNEKRRPGDRTTDLQMNFMFRKIVEFHLKYIILKQKHFYDNVQKDFIAFINMEFTNKLNPEILELIMNVL